jgi:hypothetical protein
MGWQVIFCAKQKTTPNNLESYLDLVRTFSNYQTYDLLKLEIFKQTEDPRYSIVTIDCCTTEYESHIRNAVEQSIVPVENMVFRFTFNIERYVEARLESPPYKLMKTFGELSIGGNKASWNSGRARKDLNIFWDIGDHLAYGAFRRYHPWTKNIPLVIGELEYLLDNTNLVELVGTAEGCSTPIEESFLLFIDSSDIKDEETLLAAAIESDIEITPTKRGYIVYSKQFAKGNLKSFFSHKIK